MENLVKATLDYLTYCASKEPRIGQHYPVVESADFRKQPLEPRSMPIVEEIFALIDFASLRQLTHIHGVKSVEATRDLADELKRLKEKARKKKAKERANKNSDSEPGTPNQES